MQRVLLVVSLAWLLLLPFHETGARLGLGLALGVSVLSLALRQTRWLRSPLDLPLFLLLGSGFASAAFSPSPAPAFSAAAAGGGLLAFFLGKEIASSEIQVKRLLAVLTFVAASVAVLAALARMGGPDWTSSTEAFDRAGLHVLLFVLISAVAVTSGKRGWLALSVVLGLGLVTLPFSAVHVVALVCTALLPALAPRRWRQALVLLVTMVLVLVATTVLVPAFPPAAPETGSATEITSRAAAWRDAIEELRQAPLLGLGPGRFARDARSDLFRSAAEGGLVGLALFLLLWVSFYTAALPRAWRLIRSGDPRGGMVASVVLAVTCVHLLGLVEVTLGNGTLMMVTLLLAGVPFGTRFQPGEAA